MTDVCDLYWRDGSGAGQRAWNEVFYDRTVYWTFACELKEEIKDDS